MKLKMHTSGLPTFIIPAKQSFFQKILYYMTIIYWLFMMLKHFVLFKP
jgi:hypothetical protein